MSLFRNLGQPGAPVRAPFLLALLLRAQRMQLLQQIGAFGLSLRQLPLAECNRILTSADFAFCGGHLNVAAESTLPNGVPADEVRAVTGYCRKPD